VSDVIALVTAQRSDAFVERCAARDVRLRAKPHAQFIRESFVGPILDLLVERDLDVVTAA
jgi:hypothetical protein